MSNQKNKSKINQNFDASMKEDKQKNDIDVLVATDAISEGFNLHRAGTIFNYDIPYNPTRVVQRFGRINKLAKNNYLRIYIFTIFPNRNW